MCPKRRKGLHRTRSGGLPKTHYHNSISKTSGTQRFKAALTTMSVPKGWVSPIGWGCGWENLRAMWLAPPRTNCCSKHKFPTCEGIVLFAPVFTVFIVKTSATSSRKTWPLVGSLSWEILEHEAPNIRGIEICVNVISDVTQSPMRTGKESGVEVRLYLGVSGLLLSFFSVLHSLTLCYSVAVLLCLSFRPEF